jgi:hypothetical protein
LFFEDMNKIYKSLTTLRKRMRSKWIKSEVKEETKFLIP